jgi:hypothetical protein
MSESWKTEHDQRQYRLMIERLEAYRERKIGAHALIASLKGLLAALKLRNGDWVERATSEWGNLEIAYALECDRCEEAGIGLGEVNNRLFEMDSVKASISNMEHLVRERLDALA